MKPLTALQFIALVLTVLALVPAGAHFFELPNKMALAEAEYFTVQQIYRGWSLFGIALFGSLLANLMLAGAVRRDRAACVFAATAFLLMAATLVIFFIFIYPANRATEDWTVVPANWEALRMRWEYTHAVNAVLTFLAFLAVTASIFAARRPTLPPS